MRDPDGTKFFAAATLLGAVGTAVGIVLISKGRARDVYPWAAVATLAGGVVGAAHVLSGDVPPKLSSKVPM